MNKIYLKIAELAHAADVAGETALADKLDDLVSQAALDISEPVSWSDQTVNTQLPATAPAATEAPPTDKPKKTVAEHHRAINKMLHDMDRENIKPNMNGTELRAALKQWVGIDTSEPGMTWGKIYRAIRERAAARDVARGDAPAAPAGTTSDNLRKHLKP